LGMVMYNRRNYEGAIENFDKCVALQSNEIQCWYIRGLAYYNLGECDDAWRVLTESLQKHMSGGGVAEDDPVLLSIREGLRLVTTVCSGYMGQALPTVIPTEGPLPTPLGSAGG
jgi:hypothetical protein